MKSRRGFSLIELALVLGISGLMLSFVLQSQQSASTADCYASTKLQLRDINGAIQRFARKNERLPIPAARNVGVEAVTFGRESSAANIDTVGTTSWGALPFQALGLAPSYASDCWGNKITYVVTTALTTNATLGGYLDPNVVGSIAVKKDASTNSSTTNAYAVISHGEDALGAVKSNYSSGARGWCTGGATLASQNCLATSTTVASASFNNGKDAGVAYFDDLVVTSGRPLMSINGTCNNAVALGCAAGSVAPGSDNGLTACNTSRTWVCNGSTGGTNSGTCSFANPVCLPCASTSLTWGGGCSANFPATAHTATTPSTANTNPTFTTVGSYHYATSPSNATATCTNGVFSAPVGTCVAQPPPVAGVCNNSTALSCSAGTAMSDNGLTACNTSRTWVCQGSNGGANSGTCSRANPACANCTATSLGWGAGCVATFPTTAHGATTPAQTNSNISYNGSATSVCSNGSFSGPSGSCTPKAPVNGSCNSAAPGGACAAGTKSGDNNATACGTTRTWNCNGEFGGSNTSCSYVNPACAINGVCNNSVALGCTAGSATSDNGQTSCGTNRQWVCAGSGGGSNSGTCSIANAACACPAGGTTTESYWGGGDSPQLSDQPPYGINCGSCVPVETGRVFDGCESTGETGCNEFNLAVTFNCQSSCPAGTALVKGACRPNSCLNGAYNPIGCTRCGDGDQIYRIRRDIPCPAGYTGTYNIYEKRTSCSSGWIVDSSSQPYQCTAVTVAGVCGQQGYMGPGNGCPASCNSGTETEYSIYVYSPFRYSLYGACQAGWKCQGSGGGATVNCSNSGDYQ